MGKRPPRTALLLIDIQNGFLESSFWGPSRSNSLFEQNAASLLKAYRSLISSAGSSGSESSPYRIIHVAHSSLSADSPLHPSSPGFGFQTFAAPKVGEYVIKKHVNSAFIGTNLETLLREHFGRHPGILYIAGLTTDHCVSTTTRMAGNLKVCDVGDGDDEKGEVILVEDATAAWQKSEIGFEAELVHKVHVESLREFATVAETEEVLKEWQELLEKDSKI